MISFTTVILQEWVSNNLKIIIVILHSTWVHAIMENDTCAW